MAERSCINWLSGQVGKVDVAGEPTHLRSDSQQVQQGDWLLIADRVSLEQAQKYASQAMDRGATLVLCCHKLEGANCCHLSSVDAALVPLVQRRYAQLLHRCKWVGITGTNGKTTTAWVAHHASEARTAYIGTLGLLMDGHTGRDLSNTTPEFLHVAAELEQADIEAAFVEISSIGIDQQRWAPVSWDVRVLTTLGRDHLDYHGTLQKYHNTKIDWFLAGKSLRIVHKKCLDHFSAEDAIVYENDAGTEIPAILGSNVTAARLSMHAIAIRDNGRIALPPGRLEKLQLPAGTTCFIDYAHTPDALEAVLASLRLQGRLICVFGAGGDRDRGKRPGMARAVLAGSEVTVFTSDNPRHENPEKILDDLVQVTREGVQPPDRSSGSAWFRITDRKQGIRFACHLARPDDIVLIAGKGDENYLETAQGRIPWSDREIVQELGGKACP